MSDTRITSANLMHPAERNVHNKIFVSAIPIADIGGIASLDDALN